MALVLKDRVKEQTTTTGTGSVTLGGAVSGFEAFSAVGDGNTTYYAIVHQSANEWEVGLGTYTAAGTTLSRDTILESSNSDAAVDFSAGTKDVFVTYPSDKAIYRDAAGEVSVTRATSATFAASATNATTAVSATNATSATFATSATRATSATFATSATEAATAIFATSATNATNINGGTVSSTDGTFNTLTVVTSASVGGTLNTAGVATFSSGSAAAPGIAFAADTDNGAVYINTNNWGVVAGGSYNMYFQSGQTYTNKDLYGLDAAGPAFINEAATATNPTLAPNRAELDTGIGWASADNLTLVTGGNERVRVNASGNVGIGTTSPSAELDIESTSPEIHLNDSDGVLGGAITSRAIFQASGANHGIVGFGTGSGNMAVTNTQGPLFLQADTNSGHASSYITFTVDNSAKMRIRSDGNVGIGTTNPSYDLDVVGDINFTGTLYDNGSAFSGGGKVLQVITGTTSTQAASTSSSYADTNLSASITPSSTSNKVLVLVSQSMSSIAARAGAAVNIVRGATQVAEFNQISNVENQMGNHYLTYLDSPSSTSALTYKTQFKRIDQSGTLQAQRNDASGNATSVITLIEIAG